MKAVIILLALCGTVMGQISAEEAQKRLAEKQAARDSARSKPVTITQGEYDDMRAEISKLRAEVAQLKSSQVASAAPAATRMPTSIVVGMTRDELMKYVNLHHDRYTVLAANPTPSPAAIPGQSAAPSSEVIKLSTKAMREIIVGVSSNGVNKSADTHKELRPDSTLTLNLTDNKVASIQEDKLPPGPDEATPDNIRRAVAGLPQSARRGR